MTPTVPTGNQTAIVGHDREQEQLRAFLADALNGQGQLVLISGEAGFGKTRLVRDLVRRAEERGALFWADDPGQTATPPGHSRSLLMQLIEERASNLAISAEAYAKAGMAVADAFISCWHTKYRYNLIRPISYIQEHIGPGWGVDDRALPVTPPPFPEYTSGHSVQTGAFAQVLFDLFGEVPFTDHTHDGRGLAPRSFSN